MSAERAGDRMPVPGRVGGVRVVGRSWRVTVPVVVGNALVQAATAWPFLTPGFAPGFLALVLVSFAALAAGAALVAAACTAVTEPRTRFRMPGLRLWVTAAAAVLAIGLSAVVAAPLFVLTTSAAFVVLPSVAGGARAFSGFRAFARAPLRAIGLALLTVLVLLVLWLGGLLSGFFITGAASALLSWLGFGVAGVLLLGGWTALLRRTLG
ncbi:hypothetical protein VD659_04425 [Herbiconiux sp. 11R-BC]|uniref:hypothetical protein n=1 Tax=Herbiconiux sp. 11R-BC TaxID=3111637 RepID=UPI003BFE2849